MLICGIKLTHDAAVAVMDDERLLFSMEIEKLNNNARYSAMSSIAQVECILRSEGIHPRDIEAFVIDGWKGGRVNAFGMHVAPYHQFDGSGGLQPMTPLFHDGLNIGGSSRAYWSYQHMTTHVIGTYAASPFAARREHAYVITWDGGQNPRVSLVNPDAPIPIKHVSSLLGFYGIIYGIMGYYYGPYARPEVANIDIASSTERFYGGYDKPGKLMSYIGLGAVDAGLLISMERIYDELVPSAFLLDLGYKQNGILEHEFMRRVQRAAGPNVAPADALRTVHEFIERKLVAAARQVIPEGSNLLFTGGSALNIKWNSALRASGHFARVWVPPFPNDTGNALGAAAALRADKRDEWYMDWDPYRGPRLGSLPAAARRERCDVERLARELAANPETPIVVLNGRAEIGPRALGHRSIIAAPTSPKMKALLNELKGREPFRPVAPMCLEERAPEIFFPGTPDPHMLFDHDVLPNWVDRLPAIMHTDGSARLQTVGTRDGSPFVRQLLLAFHRLTGIPVLCNTSANLNGSGFFPDIDSALAWAQQHGLRVWAEGYFYSRD